MIRRWLITLIALPLALLVTGLLLYRSNVVPERQCSVLYREYKNVDGIRATFIRDFQVNDTLTVDVTMLSATTDAGWDTLKVRFGIKELPPEYQARIDAGEDAISVRQFPKNAPALMKETSSNSDIEVMGISRLYHTVSVFHTTTEQEIHAVLIYNFSLNK